MITDGNYHFELILRTPDNKEFRAEFSVEPKYYKSLAPYDLCDSPATAYVVGGISADQALRIDGDREAITAEISQKAAKAFVDCLKKQDKKNGYPQS